MSYIQKRKKTEVNYCSSCLVTEKQVLMLLNVVQTLIKGIKCGSLAVLTSIRISTVTCRVMGNSHKFLCTHKARISVTLGLLVYSICVVSFELVVFRPWSGGVCALPWLVNREGEAEEREREACRAGLWNCHRLANHRPAFSRESVLTERLRVPANSCFCCSTELGCRRQQLHNPHAQLPDSLLLNQDAGDIIKSYLPLIPSQLL